MRFKAFFIILGFLLLCGAFVAWSSVWTVNQNESGVVFRFGKVSRVCGAGMQFTLPYPIEWLERVVTTEVRTMPVGFKFVDRLRSLRPEDDEVQWLTADMNIVELQTVVQYRILDPVAYLTKMGLMPDGRPREFALQQFAEAALTELTAQMSVDDVLSSGKARLQEESRGRMQDLCDSLGLGLQISSVNITKVTPPLAVISAFNDVSSAIADHTRLVSEAEGYAMGLLPASRAEANRLLQDAEIYRADVRNAAQSRADRFSRLAHEVRFSPTLSRTRLWLETIEKAFSSAKIVVYAASENEADSFVFHQIEP